MLVSGGKGLAFQRRRTQGGLTTSTDGGAGTPRWLWLSRRGTKIAAYVAVTRGAWHLVGSDTYNMNEQVLAGLALSGHDATVVSTAVLSSVSVVPAPAPAHAEGGVVGVR